MGGAHRAPGAAGGAQEWAQGRLRMRDDGGVNHPQVSTTVQVDFNALAANGLLTFRPEHADGPVASGMFVVAVEDDETRAPCLVVEVGGRLHLMLVRSINDVR